MSNYDWEADIVPRLHSLQPVSGGFTETKRGKLTMPDGTALFIKIASGDADTKKWVAKEVETYKILGEHGYTHAPRFFAASSDSSGFATEFLDKHIFNHVWDERMLQEVMSARKDLEALKPFFEGNELYDLHNVVSVRSRWSDLANDSVLERIQHALSEAGVSITIDRAMVDTFASEMSDWKPRQDTLVHQDIRADNFGYDPAEKAGMLVDWNWLCIGDTYMDVTSMFVSVRKLSGIDPYTIYPELYSRQSLLYIIGYWLAALSEVKLDAYLSTLRAHQAQSVEVALSLLKD